jgi:hypothetical protein
MRATYLGKVEIFVYTKEISNHREVVDIRMRIEKKF